MKKNRVKRSDSVVKPKRRSLKDMYLNLVYKKEVLSSQEETPNDSNNIDKDINSTPKSNDKQKGKHKADTPKKKKKKRHIIIKLMCLAILLVVIA